MKIKSYTYTRYIFLTMGLLLLLGILSWRLLDLQIRQNKFLKTQGALRVERLIKTPAPRGILLDRNNEPLAISAPVMSVWVNPKKFAPTSTQKQQLCNLLNISVTALNTKLLNNNHKEFLYLARQLNPEDVGKINAFHITGLHFLQEYKRFYPSGKVSAQTIGITNIDDQGIDGLEKALNKDLTGTSGVKRIIRDCKGFEVDRLKSLSEPTPGKNITLSIDQRLQYWSYSALKNTVLTNKAISGSAVVLSVDTGEVLALVNYPSFNPNVRHKVLPQHLRNNAIVDYFEPGSTMKTFSMASFLEYLPINANTIIDVSPGFINVRGGIIRDTDPHNNIVNHGKLDLYGILEKSSNVGSSKLALLLPNNALKNTYERLGFGFVTGSEFPGEIPGVLMASTNRPIAIDTATQSFGYGVGVTTLQLARAYTILGAGGIRRDVTFLKNQQHRTEERIMSERVARQTVELLTATIENNPKSQAKVPGYRIAGKTGTARKLSNVGGYQQGHYRVTFGGLAPAIHPKFAIVVVINEPSAGVYYSNLVAAPLFAEIAKGALQLFGIQPDLLDTQAIYIAKHP